MKLNINKKINQAISFDDLVYERVYITKTDTGGQYHCVVISYNRGECRGVLLFEELTEIISRDDCKHWEYYELPAAELTITY